MPILRIPVVGMMGLVACSALVMAAVRTPNMWWASGIWSATFGCLIFATRTRSGTALRSERSHASSDPPLRHRPAAGGDG